MLSAAGNMILRWAGLTTCKPLVSNVKECFIRLVPYLSSHQMEDVSSQQGMTVWMMGGNNVREREREREREGEREMKKLEMGYVD